jgi:hypothetical protein
MTALTNSVIQGDCVQVLAQLPSASIDMVLTDPPYIARYVSRDGQRIANDDRADWLHPPLCPDFPGVEARFFLHQLLRLASGGQVHAGMAACRIPPRGASGFSEALFIEESVSVISA